MNLLKLSKLVALFLVLIVIAAGCKKDDNPTESTDNPSQFAGTWKMTKVTVTYSGSNIELTPEQAETQMTIVAGSDGSYKMTTVTTSGTTVQTGTWKINGTKMELKYSDGTSQSLDFTLNGNKCTIKTTVNALGTTLPATLEFTKQ